MLAKKAQFNLIDIQALNTPVFNDDQVFLVDQKLKIASDAMSNTVKAIKLASNKEAELETDGDNTEFDLEAEVKSHPDSLYVKCFAIKADETNDNGDYFGYDELKSATSTFVGVPIFTNHNNTDAEESRGKVVHSWWDEERKGIMIIARVDAEAYPKLARGIKEEYIMGTSMGASRGHDMVSMADGSKKRVDDLQIGDPVYTHFGNIEKVAAICETQKHNKLYHIAWSGNKNGLALSYEHPVLILKREDVYFTRKSDKEYRKHINDIRDSVKTQFVPASELKYNDYVLEWVDKSIINDSKADEDIAFLMGIYAAEGYCGDGFVEFCFGADDKNIDKTRKILTDKFEGKVVDIDRTDDRNGFYVRIYDKLCVHECMTYVGTGSRTKRLHPWLKKWSPKLQKIFLGAYLDGDGCLIKERTLESGHSSGVGAMQASSASLQLLKDIRQICLRIGCPATLSSHDRIASKSTIMDSDTEYVEHMLYISNIISNELRKYSHKAKLSPEIKKPKFDSFFYKDYIAHRIKEVTIVDNIEPTYYVQVGELDDENSDHSYILNDIATHNCQVKFSLCSICHNYAETPDQYCSHIRERKTRKISAKNEKCAYHTNGGEESCPLCGCEKKEEKKLSHQDQEVFEYNYGIKFIENSFVVNPACHDCGVTEVIDPQEFLKKVADVTEKILKIAGSHNVLCDDKKCVKIAGQKELDQLRQALDLMTSVSQSMLQQKDQLDLEFLSDLISVVADLQKNIDELTQQGYGNLQSPQGEAEPATPEAPSSVSTPISTPTPTSKVNTGPAGEAGTVTGPMAKKQIDLTKISDILQKRRQLLHCQPKSPTLHPDKHLQFNLNLNT